VSANSQGGYLDYAYVPTTGSTLVNSHNQLCWNPYFIASAGTQDSITTNDVTVLLQLYEGGVGTSLNFDIQLYDETTNQLIASDSFTPTITATSCSSPDGQVFELSGTTYTISAGNTIEVVVANNGEDDFGICFGGDAASYVTINPLDIVTDTVTSVSTSTVTSVSTVTSTPPPVTTTVTSTTTKTQVSTVTTTLPAVTSTVTSVSTATTTLPAVTSTVTSVSTQTSTQTIQPSLLIEVRDASGNPITGQSITVTGPGATSPVTTDGSGNYLFPTGVLTEGDSYTASTVINGVTLSGTVTLEGNSVILLEPTAPTFPTPEFPYGVFSIIIPILALAAFFVIGIRVRPQKIKQYFDRFS